MENLNELSPGEIDHCRQIINKSRRPYIGLSDRDLTDELLNQEAIVNDCILLAQRIAKDTEPKEATPLEGLYFSFYRYSELVAELGERLNKEPKLKKEANV